MTTKGIDVSKWQTKIDWAKVKASGIQFAIIRAGYMQKEDAKFKTHIAGALAQGINVGVYCYAKAKTPAEAVAEANHILTLIKPFKVTYPVFYDLEDAELLPLTNSQRTDIAIAFCEQIENAGYYAGIYANKNWLENLLEYNRLKPYDVWLAQWAKEPSWNGGYGVWQYGQAEVDGVGNCDCNLAYRDYPTIISEKGLNNCATKTLAAGAKVRYKGKVQFSSWGIGKPIQVNGTFTVRKIIKNRKYGVQIDKLGWVAENACSIV